MSDSHAFTQEESLRSQADGLELNKRLVLSLPLFMKLLPVSLLFIIFASVTPSVFRWYAGSFAQSSHAHTAVVPYLNWELPVHLSGLWAITLFATLSRMLAWAFFEISGMWSAQSIHANMVRALSQTRTTFFDENPSGRIINRLVRDYDEVRSTAVIFLGDMLNAMTELLSIAALALIVSPWAAVSVFPLLFCLSYIQWQRSAILDHARGLASVSVSKVFHRKNDLVEGREIFLLYGQAQSLMNRMARAYRDYIEASALGYLLETWASFWVRTSAELFSFVVLVFLVFLLYENKMDQTLAGVIISALFGVRGTVGWLDHSTSLISRSVPHVRRVFEVVDLPHEVTEERKAPETSETLIQAQAGTIEFINYSMSYRATTPLILKNLSLTVPKGSKTALVGRTGSGKTSLMQALFRMVYVHEGDIRIGGKSIYGMELDSLRTLFGVIPQAPYLFAGTLRSNLDRFGTLSDEKLQAALSAVGLRLELDQGVIEGGQNLSVGERQLICLARVIAADRAIILMDEPTSGMDPETDARIHRVLKTALRDKTVITIAHRRESLGSYDQVIEMSQGSVQTV